MDDQLILFMECVNLNSENCTYTKKPEEILSLFSNPETFMDNSDKIQELNNQCFDCDWFQKKETEIET
jgi:hypothetical protein